MEGAIDQFCFIFGVENKVEIIQILWERIGDEQFLEGVVGKIVDVGQEVFLLAFVWEGRSFGKYLDMAGLVLDLGELEQ